MSFAPNLIYDKQTTASVVRRFQTAIDTLQIIHRDQHALQVLYGWNHDLKLGPTITNLIEARTSVMTCVETTIRDNEAKQDLQDMMRLEYIIRFGKELQTSSTQNVPPLVTLWVTERVKAGTSDETIGKLCTIRQSFPEEELDYDLLAEISTKLECLSGINT